MAFAEYIQVDSSFENRQFSSETFMDHLHSAQENAVIKLYMEEVELSIAKLRCLNDLIKQFSERSRIYTITLLGIYKREKYFSLDLSKAARPTSIVLDEMETEEETLFERDRLHMACKKGNQTLVEKLVLQDGSMCFQRDRFVTAAGETCFHLAIKNNQTTVVEHLLEWIRERPEFAYLLNLGDYDGNTALHLSCSRKQHQIVRALLSSTSVNVNALNSSGITALDILHVVPYSGKLDLEINMILREAGGKRARDLTEMKTKPTDNDFGKGPSDKLSDIRTARLTGWCLSLLLLMFTATATITFQAVFHFPASRNKQDSILLGSFICFNSTTFIVSIAMIIYILHQYPLKPWPQLSISTLYASYMCIIMTKSPNNALLLLLLSIPFLVMAAGGKFLVLPIKRSLHSRPQSP
ncbi:hypothetical protein NMG60_11002970 [Bertholletia excelsa]